MDTTHNFDILHFKSLLSSLTMRHKLKAGEKHFDATITDNTNPVTTEDTSRAQESIAQSTAENDKDSDSIDCFDLMNKISERAKEMKSSICRLEKENAELKALLNSNNDHKKDSSDISENEDQKLPPAVGLQTQNSSKIRTAPVHKKLPTYKRRGRKELGPKKASFNDLKSSSKQPLTSNSAFEESTRPNKVAKNSLQVDDMIVADSLMTKKKPVVEIDDRVSLINESDGMDQKNIEYCENKISDIEKPPSRPFHGTKQCPRTQPLPTNASVDESASPEKAAKESLQVDENAADSTRTENKVMVKVGDLVRIAHDWEGTGLDGIYGKVVFIFRNDLTVDHVDNTCEFNEKVILWLRVQQKSVYIPLKYVVNYTLLKQNASNIFEQSQMLDFDLNESLRDQRMINMSHLILSKDNHLNTILQEYNDFIGNVKQQIIEKRVELMSYMRWKAHKDYLEY